MSREKLNVVEIVAQDVVQKIVDSGVLNADELELVFNVTGVRCEPTVDPEVVPADGCKYFARVGRTRKVRGEDRVMSSPCTLVKFRKIPESEWPYAVHELLKIHDRRTAASRISIKKVCRWLAYFFEARRLEYFLEKVDLRQDADVITIKSKRDVDAFMSLKINFNENISIQFVELFLQLYCSHIDFRKQNGDIVFRRREAKDKLPYDANIMIVFAAASCGIELKRMGVPHLVEVQ